MLSFIESLIRFTGGYLSSNAMQRIVRTLFFLCACHSSFPVSPENVLQIPVQDEDTELFSFKILKDLIWAVVYRTENAGPAQFLPDLLVHWSSGELSLPINVSTDAQAQLDVPVKLLQDESYDIARDLTFELIDDIIDTVEISRISEFVLTLVSRVNTQPTSNKFWFKLLTFSKKLFSKVEYRNVFLILCAFCKMARMEIREGCYMERDMGTKLIAFEAIIELCGNSCTVLNSSKVMGYQIRRLVVPCILNNMDWAFKEPRIFTKVYHQS